MADFYVDVVNGSDSASGTTPGQAWKSVNRAWDEIPTSATLTTGYRFNLMNGTYTTDQLPNYWELKEGTASFPIILRAATSQTAVKFTRDINMANVSYFYLIGIEISPAGGGDAFHCEGCDHLLIRGCTLNGGSTTTGAHETLKVNQSQYVYIENNNILYADDNNIDFVGVQYGHIIGNNVHEASDWCAYVKGGSAYIRVESNTFYNCGTGGFTAGQGSGFQFMTSPWLHYEAYDIKFINNLIHDTEGAAFGTNGGYNILFAHNTAYKIGTRDHLIEVVFGERTCDGNNDGDADSTCAAYNVAGGWGPDEVRTTPEPIGNKNVFILNNILYNPDGTEAPQHFAIYEPRTPSGDVNLSTPQYSDTNLVIAGNVIWNGSEDTPFGIEESDQGCQSGNPTCNLAQLENDNEINDTEPELRNPNQNDLRPQSDAALFDAIIETLSSFPGGDIPSPPSVPAGVLTNSFTRDFSGVSPEDDRIVGAFAATDSALTPPIIDGSTVPSNPGSVPTLSNLKVTLSQKGPKIKVAVGVNIATQVTLNSATVVIRQGSKTLGSFTLTFKSGAKYTGSLKVKAKPGKKLTVSVTAINGAGQSSKSKKVSV